MTHTLGSILITYSWLVAAILVFFLFLIARFYELRFEQRSFYQLLLIPSCLFVAAAIWDAFFVNDYTGDPLLDFLGAAGPDMLLVVGGLLLLILSYSLFRTMMGGRG